MSMHTNPFEILGLPVRRDLTDEQVDVAWRKIAVATHPDRPDGGDLARYTQASAAFAELRVPWSRSEAYADVVEQTRTQGYDGLVCRSGDACAVAADAVDDLVGGLGPPERPGVGIPELDPDLQRSGELVEGAEHASVQAAALQFSK